MQPSTQSKIIQLNKNFQNLINTNAGNTEASTKPTLLMKTNAENMQLTIDENNQEGADQIMRTREHQLFTTQQNDQNIVDEQQLQNCSGQNNEASTRKSLAT